MSVPTRILLHDSDEAARRERCQALEAAGYEVAETGAGDAALEIGRRARPAVAVIARRSAGDEGLGERLRSDPRMASMLVMEILSTDRNTAPVAPAESADATLTEPVEPATLLAVVRSLARLHAVESALGRSHRRYGALAAATGEAVWNTDETGYSGDAYDWWESTTGQAEAQARMSGWVEQVHPAERAAVAKQWQRALAKRAPFEMEYRLRTQSGDYRLYQVRGIPIFESDGAFAEWVGTATDITQRRAAERQLRFLADISTVLSRSLEYEVTMQQIAELIVPELADWCVVDAVDEDGNIHMMAVAHVDSGKIPWAYEIRRRYPAHISQPVGLPKVIRTGKSEHHPHVTDEMIVAAARDAETLAVLREIGYRSVIVVPLWSGGHAIGALTLVSTSEERLYDAQDLAFAEEVGRRAALAVENARLYRAARKAQAELEQINSTLEQRVEERTADLERSNRELDQFAYVASHDLRAPLRAIDHLAGWIAEDNEAALTEESRGHLAKLRGRAKRMERLLEDLLLYSRVGRERQAPEPVDLAELCRSAVDLLALPRRFSVTVVEPMPSFLAERVPLETVIRNLVDNACKHHHQPQQGHVRISAQDRDSAVEIVVEDDGPGIAPEFHERIFGVFQTLKPRDQMEGSGMGLAIVRKAVEARGGTVQLESASGAGAAFRLTWPKA